MTIAAQWDNCPERVTSWELWWEERGKHINLQCQGETLKERSRVILKSDVQNGVSRISID